MAGKATDCFSRGTQFPVGMELEVEGFVILHEAPNHLRITREDGALPYLNLVRVNRKQLTKKNLSDVTHYATTPLKKSAK